MPGIQTDMQVTARLMDVYAADIEISGSRFDSLGVTK